MRGFKSHLRQCFCPTWQKSFSPPQTCWEAWLYSLHPYIRQLIHCVLLMEMTVHVSKSKCFASWSLASELNRFFDEKVFLSLPAPGGNKIKKQKKQKIIVRTDYWSHRTGERKAIFMGFLKVHKRTSRSHLSLPFPSPSTTVLNKHKIGTYELFPKKKTNREFSWCRVNYKFNNGRL